MAATLGGRTIGVSSFSSSSSSSSYLGGRNVRPNTCSSLSLQHKISACKSRGFSITCSALQESSASASSSSSSSTTTTTTTTTSTDKEEEVPKAAAPAKAKAKAKPAAKPLAQMMEEDIIPPLNTILQSQNDISEITLSFQDNKLEGSFQKKGYPYSFWAFFPDGSLTGVRGFSLSSYGSGASTVEPFLIDEKKITAKLVVFWVEKRLAAQGIIPVWNE